MKTLYYADPQPGAEGYGWATANKNLKRELSKLCTLHDAVPFADAAGTVFMPIADHDLNPVSPARGRTRNLGYTFFEYPIGPKAVENAKLYDVIFCGSTWCKDRLAEKGITNTKVLVQGVDHEIFKPTRGHRYVASPITTRWHCGFLVAGVPSPIAHERDTSFRIFSGGKFEFRKGQDIVIAAFREFLKKCPEAHLVCAWFNPWPGLIQGMKESPHLRPSPRFRVSTRLTEDMPQEIFFRGLLIAQGIPPENFTILPQLSQPALADVMRSTDLGLFPNRCEGGTNLVLMEYMSCGKPAVASNATGHKDVLTADNSAWCGFCKDEWYKPEDLRAVTCAIEELYSNPEEAKVFGIKAAETMKQWTWERAARTILEEV